MRQLSRLTHLLIVSVVAVMLVMPALAQEENGEALTADQIQTMITDANLSSEELATLITALEAMQETTLATEAEATVAAEAVAETAAQAEAEAAAQAEALALDVDAAEAENGPLGLGLWFILIGLGAILSVGVVMIGRNNLSTQTQ